MAELTGLLARTSGEASHVSDEVAKTIEEIAKGASDQALDTEVTGEKVYDMVNLWRKMRKN